MASKRNLRRKECGDKMAHESSEAAWASIRALNRKRGHQGQMGVYRCRWCSKFHIGHTPNNNRPGDAWRR